MNIGFWPFYSQTNKRTGEFQLSTCGATKQTLFMVERFKALGHTCNVAAPEFSQQPFGSSGHPVHIPSSNPEQRVHWDTEQIAHVFRKADLAILNHELMAIPLRTIYPKLRIIQNCAVAPDSLMEQAWRRADLVTVQTEAMADYVREHCETPVSVWPMAYDERLMPKTIKPRSERKIDVLFIQRCSSTNYTHHLEFLDALPQLTDLNVAFVDVTKYLRQQRPELNYVDDYFAALCDSKIAIALNDTDYFGGQAIREAIRCGCIPVCAKADCYYDLCKLYGFYTSFDRIAETVREALRYQGPTPDVSGESYQGAWERIYADCIRGT